MFEQRVLRHGRFIASAVALCSFALGACKDADPCPGVVEGAAYQIVLHDPITADNPSDCHLDWGLPRDATLTAKMDHVEEAGTCKVGMPNLTQLADWTFERVDGDEPNDGFVRSLYQARYLSCETVVRLNIHKGTGLSCFEQGGKIAECAFSVLIDAKGSGDCAKSCVTSLSATVTRE